MNNWIQILKYLIENKEKQFTINQISKALKLNYRIAHTEVKSLEEEGLIDVKKAGNSSQCSFSNRFNEKIFAVEYLRRKELLINKDLKVMCDRLSEINEQFILVLFGSHVKGMKTKHSDIDLLLISNSKKTIEEELDLLPLKTHLTAITYNDFMIMLKSKEPTVVSEALKKNIILFGVEDYYRMLKNAQ